MRAISGTQGLGERRSQAREIRSSGNATLRSGAGTTEKQASRSASMASRRCSACATEPPARRSSTGIARAAGEGEIGLIGAGSFRRGKRRGGALAHELRDADIVELAGAEHRHLVD